MSQAELPQNHTNLLKFLDEVDRMVDDVPAAVLPVDDEYGQAVAVYVNGLRVRVDTNETKLQNSLNDLRQSFACVVQAIVKYKADVMKEPCTGKRTWIHAFNGIAKDV